VRVAVRAVSVLGAIALTGAVVTACGSKPKSSNNDAKASTSSSFKACLVTDTGGVDDQSFNQSAHEGLIDAKNQVGMQEVYQESKQSSDYDPNITAYAQGHCGIIVTVGFLMGDVTKKDAAKYPKQKFAIVDYSYPQALPNVKGLVYNTAQAGFLGGYLAAGMSKTGKVATFGGQKLPTVTIYMDGYADGVAYYNQVHHKHVQVLGWNVKTQNGSFTNDFTDQTKGKSVTEQFMQAGADVIFPVAGNVGKGAAAAVQADGKGKVHMLWVDSDGCVQAKQYCSLFISSVIKGVQPSVKQAALDAKDGSFKGGNYVGTLANGGVGLAPYHDFANKVPASLQKEITQLKADIISGKVKVESKSQPSS
jgi:basic membrane protein A